MGIHLFQTKGNRSNSDNMTFSLRATRLGPVRPVHVFGELSLRPEDFERRHENFGRIFFSQKSEKCANMFFAFFSEHVLRFCVVQTSPPPKLAPKTSKKQPHVPQKVLHYCHVFMVTSIHRT